MVVSGVHFMSNIRIILGQMGTSNSKVAFEICVVTEEFVGSNLGPGISMVMFDTKNNQSPVIALDHLFQSEMDFHQAKFTIELQPWSKPKVRFLVLFSAILDNFVIFRTDSISEIVIF